MIVRSRGFIALLVALVASAVAAQGGGAAGTPGRLPTLYFLYTMNCTFSIENDAGRPVTSIEPGAYEVDVRSPIAFGTQPLTLAGPGDMTACRGMAQFQLTGPGVNLQTTITGGCMADSVQTATFQPGQTYVAQDNNQPAVTRTTFTTLTSGSPTAPPAIVPSSTKTETSTDLVGSSRSTISATLTALLGSNGKATLSVKGKPVASLKHGRYKLAITDRDTKRGFTIGPVKGKAPVAVTGVAFTGKHSAVVQLRTGRWMFSSGSNVHYFTVA